MRYVYIVIGVIIIIFFLSSVLQTRVITNTSDDKTSDKFQWKTDFSIF